MQVNTIVKALGAAVAGAGPIYYSAVADQVVTGQEWFTVAWAGLSAAVAIFVPPKVSPAK
jgi:hypothetical protein